MVKFKNFWLFECSEFQMFLNFIIAQYIGKIRNKLVFVATLFSLLHFF